MAEATPPSNDQTAPSPAGGNNPTVQDAVGGTDEEPVILYLTPPYLASSLQRRAADVRRRRMRWSEGSPPGLYWNGDIDEYQPFVLKGFQQEAIQVDSLDSQSGTSSVADAIGQSIPTTTDGHSDSDSGSESTSSSLPPTPVSDSDVDDSTHIFTPPDITRFRNNAKRRVGASTASQASDSSERRYAQGNLIGLGQDSDNVIEHQGYTLEMMVEQHATGLPGMQRIVMHIDSGSNITWILGEDYCEAHDLEGDEFRLSEWQPGTDFYDMHGVIRPNPFVKNPGPDGEEVRHPHPPYTRYLDRGLVFAHQLDRPLAFQVEDIWSWNATQQWRANKHFRYRFAIAYAVDAETAKCAYDGIIGLGLARRQTGVGRVTHTERDFSIVLAEQCVRSNGAGISRGVQSYYYVLRPPWLEESTYPSYLAIHSFPGRPVKFSAKIPVLPVNAGRSLRKWAVRLLQMEFYQVVPDQDRISKGCYVFQDDSNPDADRKKGLTVILDTGASSSDFPEPVIGYMCAKVLPQKRSTERGSSFVVPQTHVDNNDLVVDFRFHGENDQTVTVTGPAIPFLCQDFDRNGLLFPTEEAQGILGINFFHSMFVAMHDPRAPGSVPYIELAPQWPGEMPMYSLPPKHEA